MLWVLFYRHTRGTLMHTPLQHNQQGDCYFYKKKRATLKSQDFLVTLVCQDVYVGR